MEEIYKIFIRTVLTFAVCQLHFPLLAQCTPAYNFYCLGGDNIENFTLTGANSTSINHLNTGCSPFGYGNFPALSVTLFQNSAYTANVTTQYAFEFVRIWVDYNNNNIFENTESVGYGGPINIGVTFGIPLVIAANAATGTHKMRVRLINEGLPGFTGATIDPCNVYDFGETHDYSVVIAAPPSCSGIPNSGTAAATVANACSVPFTLFSTGYTSGLSNLTYLWQSSPAGLNTWSTIAGATTGNYSLTQTLPKDYRFIVKCTSSNQSDTSNVVSIGQSPFFNCYCSPITGVSLHDSPGGVIISGVEILNTSLSSNNPGTTATGYSQISPTFSNNTTTLGQGLTYNISVEKIGNPAFIGLWIDYNQSGTYDASEYTPLTVVGNNVSSTGTGIFMVPLNAVTGVTGMRVRVGDQAFTSSDACLEFSSGETEDYVVTIATTAACNSQPSAGTAVATTDSACVSTTIGLTLSGYTNTQSGITIQWQQSPAGQGSWANLPGATGAICTVSGQTGSSDYRAVVACNNTGQAAASNTVTVFQKDFMNCYCTSYANAPGQEDIFNVTVGSLFNTSGCTSGTYSNYMAITAPVLVQGSNTPFYVTIGSCGSGDPAAFKIYVDWNRDADFDDPGELVYTSSSLSSTPAGILTAGTFPVPTLSTLGMTRMRVVTVNLTTNSGGPTPCGTYLYGETEDYLVNIVAAPAPCQQPAGPLVSNITGSTAKISWYSVAGSTGYEYASGLTATPPGSGTFTPDTSVILTGLTSNILYYVHVRALCGGGYTNWTTFYFTTALSNDEASGAFPVTVNAACTGTPYTNVGSTQSASEPFASCSGTAGYSTVWYKFIAPPSGAVRVSNDFIGGTLGGDTRIAVFSASDSSDYSTFSILACDDNNGTGTATRSILFVTGLNPGDKYYIQVDGANLATAKGTFCLEVMELTFSMLNTVGACTGGQAVSTNNSYTGWTSLLDNTGNLVVNIRRTVPATVGGISFNSKPYIHSGWVRSFGTTYYLNRNYQISAASGTPYDIQFFFNSAELGALQGISPSSTISTLGVTKQPNTICQTNFNPAAGTTSFVAQSGNGSSNGAVWLQSQVPAFGTNGNVNFFIHIGAWALSIELKSFSGQHNHGQNVISWETETEANGDWFVLEKSTDGVQFTSAHQVSARGVPSFYEYRELSPAGTLSYYRLRMISAAGVITYSNTIAIRSAASFAITAYPNPVTDKLFISGHGGTGGDATVKLTDLSGRVIRVDTLKDSTGQIDMSRLAPGFYLVQYTDNFNTETVKILKE